MQNTWRLIGGKNCRTFSSGQDGQFQFFACGACGRQVRGVTGDVLFMTHPLFLDQKAANTNPIAALPTAA